MTERYTAADFANARFAEHKDGRIAMRVSPHLEEPWESLEDYHSDANMAHNGWVPVPTKPTITESEYRKGVGSFSAFNRVGFDTALRIAGVEVIPDPEPTNTEKLAALIKEVQGVNYGWIAKYLNDHGVTAPNVKDN